MQGEKDDVYTFGWLGGGDWPESWSVHEREEENVGGTPGCGLGGRGEQGRLATSGMVEKEGGRKGARWLIYERERGRGGY